MVKVIEDPATRKVLLSSLGDKNYYTFPHSMERKNLIKANILKVGWRGIAFASRFVQMFLDMKIRQVIPEPQGFTSS
jgi:hypothetical protein